MRLRVSSFLERLRSSLFFVPMLGVIVGGALGQGFVYLDSNLNQQPGDLPLGVASTVESARSLLSTIASATITFAGIAFSISLLIIQLASSQYSPRIVHTLFRDPFTKRVMALVVGTFVYCLMVLRAVRSPIEQGGDAVIPNLSVAIALILGVATILGIVAFINHSAHSMDVSEILEDVRREAMGQVRIEWAKSEPGEGEKAELDGPEEPYCVIRFNRTGWIQQIDLDALMRCVPEGGTMRLETYAGRYAIEGTPICTLSPPTDDPEGLEDKLTSALAIGNTRTMQQDESYGLRQLADVALKALSPGINDPTTAQDAIFHSAAVLGELLRRDPPANLRTGDDGRRLLLPDRHTHEDLVRLSFDEVRRAAAGMPTVCVYLLESIELLVLALRSEDLDRRTRPLLDQARLIVAGCEEADVLFDDLQMVRDAYTKRFGTGESLMV